MAEQDLGGYAERAHGVGEFEDTKLLERMMKITSVDWTVDDNTTLVYSGDIDAALRGYARNAQVLNLFRMYRADIEVTIKLNTNQFFYGALMVSLIPGTSTGTLRSERAVMDPTIISASCAESVVKTWTWSWPYPWRGLAGPDASSHPVWLYIDNLFKLCTANEDMNTIVTIQIWARFKNIRLAYPYGPNTPMGVEPQSGRSPRRPTIAIPRTRHVSHPADDPGSGLDSAITNVVDAVTSVPAKVIDGAVGTLDSFIDTGLGMLLGGSVLDKPDQVEEQKPMIIEASKDLFAADIADTNVCLSLNKAKYVDPAPSRMPLSKDWTLHDYAKIPGLRAYFEITGAGGGFSTKDFKLLSSINPEDEPRTPLDYANLCAHLKRGSVKVMMQFFTSAFISARFVVQLLRYDGTNGFDNNYDYGLSKVINVKGDTTDFMTIPWLDFAWWREQDPRYIRIKLDSEIAVTSTGGTPRIFVAVWISAGDDYQFQYPRIPLATEWPVELEPQCSIGKLFEGEFPPIVDSVFYDTDKGFSSGETIGMMTDVAKRYAPMNFYFLDPEFDFNAFHQEDLDKNTAYGSGAHYAQYVGQRRTYFGAMRACFLMRSGGYRIRQYPVKTGERMWQAIGAGPTATTLQGTVYCTPFDQVTRITVPQVSSRPFYMVDDSSGDLPYEGLSLDGQPQATPYNLLYLAARDDVQFGYPILPRGVPLPWVEPPSSNKPVGRDGLKKTSNSLPTKKA